MVIGSKIKAQSRLGFKFFSILKKKKKHLLCNHFQNGDGPLGFAGDQMMQCNWQSTSKWKKFDYQNHFQFFF